MKVVSTATKDADYYEELATLQTNKAFLQEVMEKRYEYILGCSQVPMTEEHIDRYITYAQGRIAALTWVLEVLPRLKPKPVSQK